MKFFSSLILISLLPLMNACSTHSPLETVEYVDIDQFMGDWYVIANIPTSFEQGAHNAVESYEKLEKNKVKTTFTYNQDSFKGAEKTMSPTGFIKANTGNAIWGMQFIWPIKADYRIVYLDKNYQHTIIGRNKRDFVWLMARTPSIEEKKYRQLEKFIEDIGYDTSKLQRVPQQSLSERQGSPSSTEFIGGKE